MDKNISLSSALKLAAATAAVTAAAVTCWRSRAVAAGTQPESPVKPESPQETLARLAAGLRAAEDFYRDVRADAGEVQRAASAKLQRAAQEYHRAAEEAEEATLPQEERDFRRLWPPGELERGDREEERALRARYQPYQPWRRD